MSKNFLTAVGAIVASVAIAGVVAWAGGRGGATFAGQPVMWLCAGLAFAINWVAFVPAWIARTEHYYDLTGSLTYLAVVALSLLLVGQTGTLDGRSLLLGALITIWALRLGSFLFVRVRRAGSDARFDELKQDGAQFLMAWTLQGLWVFLTLCAALAAITSSTPTPSGIWATGGALLWLLGFAIEVVADRQKSRFRSQPGNRGKFITSGLWAWSRHPNYFGEITLWVGIALIAWPTLDGWRYATLISPVFVYVLIVHVSGVPPLARRAEAKWGDDPAYRTYVARTPKLIPRPPSARA